MQVPYTAAATSKPDPTLPWAAQCAAWARLWRVEVEGRVVRGEEEREKEVEGR